MTDTSVVVVLECRGCGKQEEKELHVPPGIAIPQTFQCKDCAVKIDKRGHVLKARTRKSLSLDTPAFRIDRFRAGRLPAGMTGTKRNRGAAEVVHIDLDLDSIEREFNEKLGAYERRLQLTVLRHPDLAASLSHTERSVLELRDSRTSYDAVVQELARRGTILSKAGVFQAHKRALAKVEQTAIAMRKNKDPRFEVFDDGARPVVETHEDDKYKEVEVIAPTSVAELEDSRYTSEITETGTNGRYLEAEPDLGPHLKVPADAVDDYDSEDTDLILGMDREDETGE